MTSKTRDKALTVDMVNVRHGFDTTGAFVVVDDTAQVSAYAFPSSTHAVKALRAPDAVAREMVTGARSNRDSCNPAIIAALYERCCAALALGRHGLGTAIPATE